MQRTLVLAWCVFVIGLSLFMPFAAIAILLFEVAQIADWRVPVTEQIKKEYLSQNLPFIIDLCIYAAIMFMAGLGFILTGWTIYIVLLIVATVAGAIDVTTRVRTVGWDLLQ